MFMIQLSILSGLLMLLVFPHGRSRRPVPRRRGIRPQELFPELLDQLVIFRMGTNPVPNNVIALANANSSVIHTDSDRINWTRRMNGLKTQTWVMRVLYKKTICLPRLFSNVGRQFCEGFPKLVRDVGIHKVSGSSF